MKPLRITFLLPHAGLSGGIRVVAIYAQHLQQRGHSVTIVSTPLPTPTLKQRLAAACRGHWLPRKTPHGPSHLDNLDLDWRILDTLRPITNKDVPDADVVVATWWETADWMMNLHPDKGTPVYFCQGFKETDSPGLEATYHLPIPKITVSQWVADNLRSINNDHPITIIPNAVDTQRFARNTSTPRNPLQLGMVYAHVSIKGCDIALDACERVRRSGLPVTLTTFGNDRIDPDTIQPWQTHTTQPPQQDIPSLYAASHAWLFPSRAEGFGLPILEAMACRTPVIGTPAGAAPELIGQGGGILVPHEDPQAMADAILRICNMPDHEWQAMADAAYQTATSYTWDDATDRFEQALATAARS
ncbi:glycosyltransferase family 4 protein [Mucisphaera calidilacus]|uniref:GDP-mannose-dependent alpha-(1-6)-phosphatidylinositol monomannoside mannosyltransferase n=1 Tax=Mucisphaera calidilacus TaxID=2527982 RepID=A0A518BTL9_9BACT|nr:glycosyltransferase family 4 protein [Mucisphaera calidilacus]QDU70309.1 GDP-mannose-dependent alpha-(1-6)-phosphatidylinositol monomannoside mannosyltransferase [Mucisphaera calidilacus]